MSGVGLAIRGFNRAAGVAVGGFASAGTGTGSTPPVAGSVSLVSVSQTAISLSATEATGGTGAITHQWSRATNALGPFSNIGTNSLLLSDTGLTASTTYYYRLTYTDTLSQSATATFSASTQAESSSDLTPITISKSLTFATGGGSIGTGYGKVMQGESLAIFAQYTCSSGTLQILGTPTFTVVDGKNTVLVDEVSVALQSSVAGVSVVVDYVLMTDDLFPEGTEIPSYQQHLRCWFEASLLDGNGQTQIVRCEGSLKVASVPT